MVEGDGRWSWAGHCCVVVGLAVAVTRCDRGAGHDITAEPAVVYVRATATTAGAAHVPDPDMAARVLAVAHTYTTYPRVDDEPHWAPGPCAPITLHEDDPEPRISGAPGEGLHGRKLYFLYVSSALPYLHPDPDAGAGAGAPVGQTVVKQAWVPRLVPPGGASTGPRRAHDHGDDYLPGEPADLFVMTKLDPHTPGTDDGWVYGVVTPDGSLVKEAGKVAACVACHQLAPHDRLFGPLHTGAAR